MHLSVNNELKNQKLGNSISKSNVNVVQDNKSPLLAKTIDLNSSPAAYAGKALISFGAMKKSQFSGIDLMIVNQLKVPIEKMNTNEDFQNYCQKILDEKYLGEDNLEKLSKSEDEQAELQKEAILKDWINYVVNENDAYTPATELMILSSITKNLNENSNHLPPILDKRKVADTMAEIIENCSKNKQYQCNFDKLYRNNLQKSCLEEETQLDKSLSGWVVIPSKINDPENFAENVKKLQKLSHNSWCTKTYNAEPYLAKGDFHVYIEKGQPKLGVRFDGDVIQEIQGEKNNSEIPLDYLDIAKEHVESGKYKTNKSTNKEFVHAEEIKQKINTLKTELAEPIKQKDYQKILEYLGNEVEKDENGLMTLSKLSNPYFDVSFEDIGVNINDLLKHVKKVSGDLNLNGAKLLTSTGALEEVGGRADFDKCINLKEIPHLKKVGGNLIITTKLLTSTGPLEEVGGTAYLGGCANLKEIPNLKKVGEDLRIRTKSLTSTGALEEIGGTARIECCQNLKEIPNLKKVGNNLFLFIATSLTSTGALEEVGGTAEFVSCSNLTEFPHLKKVRDISCHFNKEQAKLIQKQIKLNNQ